MVGKRGGLPKKRGFLKFVFMSSQSDNFPKKITGDFSFSFKTATGGLYVISVVARCRSAGQTSINGGEDLRVEIDGRLFRESPPVAKSQYYNIPPAWNGAELKGLTKIVIFIIRLAKGEHSLKFIPRGGAIIEREPEIKFFDNLSNLAFDISQRAEDGDRRPWYAFVLVDLPLQSVTADASIGWHWWDGDDVKLVVDNQIASNVDNKLHRDWLWAAGFWQLFSAKRESKSLAVNLSRGIHYVEFWADRTPSLHTVNLNLGNDGAKRVPTREDPEWTRDFSDDADQIILARMIFGEARSAKLSDRARIAVGWTARNRIAIGDWRGKTYHEVIIMDYQYSAFNKNDDNRPFVENPFFADNIIDRKAWFNCYDIACKIIFGAVDDPAKGATNYFDNSIAPPSWATKENFVIKIDTIFFHRL